MLRTLKITAMGGLLILAACRKQAAPEASAGPPEASVTTVLVESKTRLATEEVPGSVRSRLRTSIEAKVSGRIGRLLVVPGQNVARGELLVELDAAEIKARLDQALALRDQARADLKRLTSLADQRAISRQDFDAAQAREQVASATVIESETMLGYTRITAPFAGVITRKISDVGDLASPGKPILEMDDPASLRLEADVPEALINNVKAGSSYSIRLSSSTNMIAGVADEIAPAADSMSRTFLIKFDLPGDSSIHAGQFGRVLVPVGETKSLRVPAGAVIQRGQMEIVFVANNGRAQLRLVKTGKRIGAEVEIISGLDAGEHIIPGEIGMLVDGQRVKVNP